MVRVKDIRKVIVIEWKTEGDEIDSVKGTSASIQVGDEEKRSVKNDGESNLFFPADFTGDVIVIVKGSKDGEDAGTITVT